MRRAFTGGAALLLVAALSIAIRLPFADLPVTADEGGYAYVAWFWSQGDVLYRDLWVDRPQLLELVFRAVLHGLGTGAADLRLGAALWNALTVLAVGAIGWRLLGQRLGVTAAAAFAVLSALPQLEGFTLNGELLTALPSTVAIGVTMAWVVRRRPWMLLVAGIACGLSFLCKQSGIDPALTLAALVGVLLWKGRMGWGSAARALLLFAAGACVPLAASTAWGSLTAGGDYWYAVYGYRLTADSFGSEPLPVRWGMFTTSLPHVVTALGGAALLAGVGSRELWRRGGAGQVVPLWLGALALCVVAGGQFHAHYYLALTPALALAAAASLPALGRAWWRARLPTAVACAALAVAVAVPIGRAVDLAREPDPRALSWQVFAQERYLTDPQVGAWIRANTSPDDRVLGMYAAADLYWHARRRSAYPYLWFRGIATIPGALTQLQDTLADPRTRPAIVAIVQPIQEIDATGTLRATLNRGYERVATVNGVAIWRRAAIGQGVS